MPSLADIARFFASLQTIEILGGIAVTAALIVLLSDWRLSLFALVVQYVFIAALLSTIVPLQIALIRVIAGVIAASTLYLTARRNDQLAHRTRRAASTSVFLIGWPFRAVALVMVGVTVISLANTTNLLNVPILFWLVALWLMGVGLLIVALTRDVFKYGLGLMTFSAGFGALYLALDSTLTIFGALSIADLLLALTLAHLAGAPTPEVKHRRRGES